RWGSRPMAEHRVMSEDLLGKRITGREDATNRTHWDKKQETRWEQTHFHGSTPGAALRTGPGSGSWVARRDSRQRCCGRVPVPDGLSREMHFVLRILLRSALPGAG